MSDEDMMIKLIVLADAFPAYRMLAVLASNRIGQIAAKDAEIKQLREGLAVFADPMSWKAVPQYQEETLPFVWYDPWVDVGEKFEWGEPKTTCIENPAEFARAKLEGRE